MASTSSRRYPSTGPAPRSCAAPGPTSSGGSEMADLKPGDAIPELRVTPDKYLPHRYAGASGDFNPIHIDADFAKSVGLPSNILHGLYSMGLVSKAAAQGLGGGDPRAMKKLTVQFRGMGLPEQEVVITGTIKEV